MNILYIWDADYPWDVRVDKICSSLMSNGHTVYVAARNLKALSQYENIDGLHIHRLKPFKNKKLNYALSFPAFFSPIWKSFLNKVISGNDIDMIIVRDLPMAIAGIWAGRRFDIPVIFDMAEDYVSMIRDIWEVRKFQGVNLLVRNPYLAQMVENYALKRFDHVLVVVKEAIDVALNGGAAANNISIVGNTPSLGNLSGDTAGDPDTLQMIKNRYSAIYTGGVTMGRGLQYVIEAIPTIVKSIPDFLFVIIGDGYASEKLRQQVEDQKLEKHVLWLGWIEHRKIFSYIKASSVGLIPHLTSAHVNTTIPNKIFDYMGCGLPVVASDAPPMKRILEEEECGVTFRSGDHKDLAGKIIAISRSEVDYGENGYDAVIEKYNWTQDEARLLDAIKKIKNGSFVNTVKAL